MTEVQKIREALDGIKGIIYGMKSIGLAFEETGNVMMATRLCTDGDDVLANIKNINEALDKIGDARLQEAQQASANVVGAAIAGIELSRPDLEIARYLSGRKEEEDFRNQLTCGGIIPLSVTDLTEWEDNLDEWLDMDEKDPEEEALLEWFALNGNQHVYCLARRLLILNKE